SSRCRPASATAPMAASACSAMQLLPGSSPTAVSWAPVMKAFIVIALASSGLEAQVARNDVALDVARAFADHIHEGVAVDAPHRVLAHDARAAMDAYRLLAHAQCRLGGDELDLGGRGRV